jgi:hypothetical protein
MTTRDYIKLAAALAESRPNTQEGDDMLLNQWMLTRHAILKVLQLDNPKFNTSKFLAATEAN